MPFSFVEFVPTNFKFEIEEKDEEVQDVPVLTGRAAREAEIAQMMASLDDNPTYTKFKPIADKSAINANNENFQVVKRFQIRARRLRQQENKAQLYNNTFDIFKIEI
jgi:hypothetical protein